MSGRAAPGTIVYAELPLRTNQGRELQYWATTRADGQGRYAFRFPYANRGAPPAVRVHAHYILTCRKADPIRVVVSEEDVRQGREVVAPDLCL